MENGVLWCKSIGKGNDELIAFLKKELRRKSGKKESGEIKVAGEEKTEGRAGRSKGWWRRGDAGAYKKTVGMRC